MTTHWTDGYQTTVNYTYGYYRELSPHYQRFCLLLNSIDCPEASEDHQHCELGFGQGVSLNIHNVSAFGEFYGTDFNPAHAAHANQLAEQSNAPHHFYDASFEELLNKDLPQFDSISLHGIWSWISHENQAIILKFIRHFLKPNGVVYISYNCMTGWAANMPIRELFYSHYQFNSTSTNALQNVQDSLKFCEELLQQNPNFIHQNPNAKNKVENLKKQNPNYLVHEYLNQDWQCFSFQQVVHLFEDIKMTYAASTDLNTILDNLNLTEEHQQFLDQIQHPVFKEQCRDYFFNTTFRRDLFVRGKNTLSPLQRKHRLCSIPFILLTTPENVPTSIQGNLGTFNLKSEIYQPILEQFKLNHYAPLTIAQIEKNCPDLDYAFILNALVLLCHIGHVLPCQPNPSPQTLAATQKLNHYLLAQASFHNNYSVLACPLTGIGLPSDHLSQLFYRAHFVDGLNTAHEFAHYTWDVLKQLGWSVLDDAGKPIQDGQQNFDKLLSAAEKFIQAGKLVIARQLKLFA